MKRALISVSDKTGIVEFCRFLTSIGIEILSTGGTAKALSDAGIPSREISDYTQFPEMMDGRLKTLHPKVHGGLLYKRNSSKHLEEAKKAGIEPIDLVVVNLYPFAETIQKPGCKLEEAIEQIDIGGPTMLRSAAKNTESVTVIVDPADYARVQAELVQNGVTSLSLRREFATKVFWHTSHYDFLIASYLSNQSTESIKESSSEKSESIFGNSIGGILLKKAQSLRYGENPHQKAALYGDFLNHFKQLHGKELSYNNILDISSAAGLITEFSEPTVAILKHTNPCGVASARTLLEAWEMAYATDTQAPFGGIIAINRSLDLELAEAISEIFSEVIIAPLFNPDAFELLKKKKNLRLIESTWFPAKVQMEYRSVAGSGLLVQESDLDSDTSTDWKVVTQKAPTPNQMKALQFAWRVVKHVKSNAIVYASADPNPRTLGIGAGQMSRVDASKLAIWKANEAGLSLENSSLASDAFFPFADGVEAAAEAGAKAIIQPGGSLRDNEVIEAANRLGLAMVFTGKRHFKH